MSQAVEPNRIPAEPIVKVIRDYLDGEADRLSEGNFSPSSVYLLADRVDMQGDTLQKLLIGRNKTIDFDLADRLLCAMNLHDLWLTDLHDLYESVLLLEGKKHHEVMRPSGSKICARAGCSTVFIPPKLGKKKIYCSDSCRTTAFKHRTIGIKTRIRGRDRAIEKLVCRAGHERTKENTAFNSKGYRFCLICHRASQRAWENKNRGRVKVA